MATHREDLQPAFAQQVQLDYAPDRPTRLAWPPGSEPVPASGDRQEVSHAASGVRQVTPAVGVRQEVSHAVGVDARGKCVVCQTAVAPGPDNWARHCATPLHLAWTDPGLVGTRADAQVSCQLCQRTYSNGPRSWQTHVKSKKHQEALARQ